MHDHAKPGCVGVRGQDQEVMREGHARRSEETAQTAPKSAESGAMDAGQSGVGTSGVGKSDAGQVDEAKIDAGKSGTGKKIAVLMGGPSDEHDVSMKSGRQVLDALGKETAFAVEIGRDGCFRIGDVVHSSLGAALDALAELTDIVFIALHGPFGEDGTVQALLEAAGLAYTGSGVLASALAMDKIRTKAIYRAHGLPTASEVSIAACDYSRAGPDDLRHILERVPSEVGFPCVVKPATLGSSFGLAIVEDGNHLALHVDRLISLGHDVLIERYLRGRELTCGVLDIAAEHRTVALPVTEIVPLGSHTFFDYVAKYTPGASEEITPARISESEAKEIQRLALAAHRAIGCRDMSRTDFILDLQAGPVLLETNTIPGFTATSLLPQGARAAGMSFGDLTRMLVDNARRRGARVPLRAER